MHRKRSRQRITFKNKSYPLLFPVYGDHVDIGIDDEPVDKYTV